MSSLELAPTTVGAPRFAPARARAGLSGLGTALPDDSVSTEAIAARVGVDAEWITRRTGIHGRRRLAPGATIADLAERAGRAALADAGIEPSAVDALIVATASADEVMPAAAPLVAGRLGAARAMAWDVNLACTGFLAALEQGAALVESGRAATVLVIAAEALTRVTDNDDRKTAALFGDGAGAVVLTAGGALALGASILVAESDDDRALVIGHDERLVRMDGQVVFARAVDAMERCCRAVLAEAGLQPADVDLVVPHQANARITAALAGRLDLAPWQVVDEIAHVGNTGAASVPLALDAARRDGRLPEQGRLLLTAFGAGFAAGAVLVDIQPQP